MCELRGTVRSGGPIVENGYNPKSRFTLHARPRGLDMNHVNLNTAPSEVRQTILSFSGHGTVFELDGRPIACLIPPPTPADDTEEWTSAKNARRFYLIDRQIAGSITEEEAGELATLQAQMGRWLDKVAPLPMEHVRQLHSELLDLANPNAALDYYNLLYSCASCNAAKQDREIPDPLQFLLNQTVHVRTEGILESRTPAASALLWQLGLNLPRFVAYRAMWIEVVRLAKE